MAYGYGLILSKKAFLAKWPTFVVNPAWQYSPNKTGILQILEKGSREQNQESLTIPQ